MRCQKSDTKLSRTTKVLTRSTHVIVEPAEILTGDKEGAVVHDGVQRSLGGRETLVLSEDDGTGGVAEEGGAHERGAVGVQGHLEAKRRNS